MTGEFVSSFWLTGFFWEILEWMESSGPELLCGQNMATVNADCSHCHYLVGGLEHVYFFPYIGNNNPNRLSYFSER